MKKLGIILFVALFAALLAFSVSAKEITFRPGTEGEINYVEDIAKGIGVKENFDRFCDGTSYIIYKFPVGKRDIVASFTATIGAQYKVEASNDNATWEVIAEAVMPEGAAENWGEPNESRTFDLAKFLTGKNGYIYVRISDANTSNGWGAYIVADAKIYFSSSVKPGQSYTFKPFTEDEAKYQVELTAGAGNDAGNHFLDADNYIVYRFPVSSKDTYALFSANIGAQYKISASSNGVKYTVLDAAVKPADATNPDWGASRQMRYIDVSDFLTAYDGYVYIKIEDAEKENGWGPYIVSNDGVSFYTTIPDLPLKSLYHNPDNAFTGAGPVPFQTTFDATDLSAYAIDGMALGIRVYVQGVSKFENNGQLELTSSGQCDQQEFHWDSTLNFNVHNGWNILVYPMSKGVNDNGALMNAINFIRLYQFSSEEYIFNVTDVFVGPQSKVEAQNASPLLYLVKDNTEGFTGAGPVVMAKNFATPFNLTGYLGTGMAIGVRLTADGIANLPDNGQLELTSSGTCDAEEATWGSLMSAGIKNGENLLVYTADGSNAGALNQKAVNFLRIYQFSDTEYTANISDIVIGPLYQVIALAP